MHLPYSIKKSIIIHVFYLPWRQHCIIWVMDMRCNTSSGVCKSLFWKFIIKDKFNSAVILFWDTTKKNEKILNYCIEEWHTSTTYNILWDVSYYPTVCLLLDTSHRTDHCITLCGKWIFDSNIEVIFPLTQDCLNYICRGNDTDEIRFFVVLHAIRAVPPKCFQRRLNIK